MEKKLPNNWVETTLGNVIELHYGKSLPKKKRTGVGYPVYGSNGIVDHHEDYLVEGPGIIVGRKGSNGEVNWVDENFFPIDTTYYVDTKKSITLKYAFYLLSNLDLKSLNRSTAIPGLNRNDAYGLTIWLPPIEDQERIVSLLDKTFSNVKNIHEHLDKIPLLIGQVRDGVLSKALSCDFLVDKTIWKSQKLESLTTKVGSGSTPRGGKSSYQSEGIPLVRSMNVHFSGIKYDGLAFLNDNQAEALKNVTIEENDVLLNITGASIGRVCLAENSIVGGRVNQHVCIIRTNEELSPEFLRIYLSSPKMQKYIFEANYGVTRQALTKSQILNLDIPYPNIDSQMLIAKKVSSYLDKLNSLKLRHSNLVLLLKELPLAILNKALKGESFSQKISVDDAKNLMKEIDVLAKEEAISVKTHVSSNNITTKTVKKNPTTKKTKNFNIETGMVDGPPIIAKGTSIVILGEHDPKTEKRVNNFTKSELFKWIAFKMTSLEVSFELLIKKTPLSYDELSEELMEYLELTRQGMRPGLKQIYDEEKKQMIYRIVK